MPGDATIASTTFAGLPHDVRPGDTILVAAGSYSENLTINKGITIHGANDAAVISGTLLRPSRIGSPVATQVLNLYLYELDHRVEGVSGAFYVRFGDDVLFAGDLA